MTKFITLSTETNKLYLCEYSDEYLKVIKSANAYNENGSLTDDAINLGKSISADLESRTKHHLIGSPIQALKEILINELLDNIANLSEKGKQYIQAIRNSIYLAYQ